MKVTHTTYFVNTGKPDSSKSSFKVLKLNIKLNEAMKLSL